MRLHALVMDSRDNVATAVHILKKDETVSIKVGKNTTRVVPQNDIPFGHKLAIKDIGQGEKIVKYGETIGQAISMIYKGEHVHVHNVEGIRGRGDRT